MIRDQQTADDRIADALWFLKGFAAAANSESADTAADLANALREVRNWINAISSGDLRLIGTDERNFYIVLAEHEYEKLVDGVRSKGGPDWEIAVELYNQITQRVRVEQDEFRRRRSDEVPF